MRIPDFTPDLFTGSSDIDRQHELMFDAAHKVLAVRDAGPEAVAKAIRFLLAYVHYHFRAEEHVMAATNYDRRDHHVRQHNLLRQQVQQIHQGLLVGEETRKLISQIQVLFEDWYLFHIREVDTPFARFIREHTSLASHEVELPSSSTLVAKGTLEPEYDGIELPPDRHEDRTDWIRHSGT